ncbi:sodium/proline symporter PutP [Spirochaetota bacterium]
MIEIPTLATFIFYLIFLSAIGIYFYRNTKNIEDYLLGGRSLGKWVTALSAQASDMSGWLLMGLPGAVYLKGLPAAWIAFGLFLGTLLNWKYVSSRLRIYTEKLDSITLPTFYEKRFRDSKGFLRITSAILILFFFTIYTSSGLVAAGKLFESMFKIDYRISVSIGMSVIVLYTFLGGFKAVSWTDLFQGALMVISIVVVPVIAFYSSDGIDTVREVMVSKNISTGLIPQGSLAILTILSSMAWGLGYFGQPHILVRFMGIRSVKDLPASMKIAISWVFISLAGAVLIGLIAIPMFNGLTNGDEEKVFIFMVKKLLNPWIAGIMLAAILSAIMSTIDSQLLVSSSSLTEDFYENFKKKKASQREIVVVGRLCVIIIAAIAYLLALNPENTVLGLVAYAWGGLGVVFGPITLFSLFSRKTTWQSALAGMITGTVVLITWKQFGMSKYMYEIVPGFLSNIIVIIIMNNFIRQTDNDILREFNEVVHECKL